MDELLKKMACLLQDIYDEGHGGEFRGSINQVLVEYNTVQQSMQPTLLMHSPLCASQGKFGGDCDCHLAKSQSG